MKTTTQTPASAKATEGKPAAKTSKKDLKEADVLMTRYARLNQSRKDLLDTIMEEVKAYETEMKETEKKLIDIGERNKVEFNADGNLVFDDGYLHIAKNTVIVTKKKFDLAEFAAAKPDFISVELKTNPIKKAFLDKDQRKELAALGVDLDTKEKIEVKVKTL